MCADEYNAAPDAAAGLVELCHSHPALSYLLSRCQVLVKSCHIHNLVWQVYVWNIMAPHPALIYTPCCQMTSPTQGGSAHFRIFLSSFLCYDQKCGTLRLTFICLVDCVLSLEGVQNEV